MKGYDRLHLLVKETTAYNEITVYETTHLYGETGKFRVMQFADDAVQGAIDMKDRSRIVLEYPRAVIHLMERNNPAFRTAFVIGHGIGTIAGRFRDRQVTVAEIDEQVAALSENYFGSGIDNVLIGDGRRLLEEQPAHAFDYIVLDAFTKKGTPRHLTSTQFFAMTKAKLAPRGAIILNLMGKPGHDKLIDAVHATLLETYERAVAFSMPGSDGAEIRNIIIVGSDRSIESEAREMAGFSAIGLGNGHVIKDR